MAAFNDAPYIEAAMKSLLNQHCEPFTLIVSDDASTDATADIAEAVARANTGPHTVRVLRQTTNLGPFHHYVELVEHQTEAELIIVGCADDLHPPGRVARLVATMDATGADVVCSNAAWIDDKGAFMRPHVQGRRTGPITIDEILKAGWVPATLGATFAFRRRLWVDTGGFRGSLIYAGGDLWLPLRAALRGGCHYLDEPLLFWRQHDRQVKRMTTDEKVGKAVSGEAHRIQLLATRMQHYREVSADPRPAVRARAAGLPGRILVETAAWVAHRRRNRAQGYSERWVPLQALLEGAVESAPAVDTDVTRAVARAVEQVDAAVAPLMQPVREHAASPGEVQAVFSSLVTVCQLRVRLIRAHLRPVWRQLR